MDSFSWNLTAFVLDMKISYVFLFMFNAKFSVSLSQMAEWAEWMIALFTELRLVCEL